jgi:hypothetical protein
MREKIRINTVVPRASRFPWPEKVKQMAEAKQWLDLTLADELLITTEPWFCSYSDEYYEWIVIPFVYKVALQQAESYLARLFPQLPPEIRNTIYEHKFEMMDGQKIVSWFAALNTNK